MNHSGTLLLLLVLSSSLSLNAWLGINLQKANGPRLGGFAAGTIVPAIPVVDPAGRKDLISFVDEPRTVLYVLSPSCDWCARDRANIAALAATKKQDFRFLALSIGRDLGLLSRYLETQPLPFPTYQIRSADLGRQLGLTATPQMILVGSDGRAENVWVGALLGQRLNEVNSQFGVELPGLLPAKEGATRVK